MFLDIVLPILVFSKNNVMASSGTKRIPKYTTNNMMTLPATKISSIVLLSGPVFNYQSTLKICKSLYSATYSKFVLECCLHISYTWFAGTQNNNYNSKFAQPAPPFYNASSHKIKIYKNSMSTGLKQSAKTYNIIEVDWRRKNADGK